MPQIPVSKLRKASASVIAELANQFMNHCKVTKKCVYKYSDNLQNERKGEKPN